MIRYPIVLVAAVLGGLAVVGLYEWFGPAVMFLVLVIVLAAWFEYRIGRLQDTLDDPLIRTTQGVYRMTDLPTEVAESGRRLEQPASKASETLPFGEAQEYDAAHPDSEAAE